MIPGAHLLPYGIRTDYGNKKIFLTEGTIFMKFSRLVWLLIMFLMYIFLMILYIRFNGKYLSFSNLCGTYFYLWIWKKITDISETAKFIYFRLMQIMFRTKLVQMFKMPVAHVLTVCHCTYLHHVKNMGRIREGYVLDSRRNRLPKHRFHKSFFSMIDRVEEKDVHSIIF